MRAVAFLVGSAVLVAVTTTWDCLLIFPGALYKPVAEIVPVAGLIDQVTPPGPLTVAVNCAVCPALSITLPGLIVTVIPACRVTTAEADFVVSAVLVAVTVTVWV